jgi:hypothetical protein
MCVEVVVNDVNYTYYLKSALRKLKAADKNEVSNRFTPKEIQSIITLSAIIIIPLAISGLIFWLN